MPAINIPQSIGSDIVSLRGEKGITQTALAKGAKMDQSRISRIEKGDLPTSDEVKRILAALSELGVATAKDYTRHLQSDWLQVEKPAFNNPQRSALAHAEKTLNDVGRFIEIKERPWPLKRQLERQREAIEQSASYLNKINHQVAFIGEVGVGKSTAISFLYGLLEPATPDGKRMDRVVLETGGGHITLCEVNVRRGPAYGILVQPQSDAETRNLVADFCTGTWLRRPGAPDADKGEKVGVSEEVQRAIRNMSGLTVKRERNADKKTTYRDQAVELALECSSEEEFRARVIERMRVDARTRREIWIDDGSSKSVMQQLRAIFRDVNNGRLADVPLPASIDLMLPDFGTERPGLVVSVVDTKGMDEIAVRADLDARLKDPRTHIVLCSTFNQAPSTSTQVLLEHLRNAHGVRVDAGKVSVLALPRPGEALAVKDDAGEPPLDDEDGYNLKSEQISRQLGAGDDSSLSGVPIFFFNAHDDGSEGVRTELYNQVELLRDSHAERLLSECAAAEEVIKNHEKQAFTMAVQEVVSQLGNFVEAHRTAGSRVRPAHQEIVNVLGGIRYASTIWAMTRRNGDYYNFSVTHHLGAGVAKDAMLRTASWFDRLQGILDTLKQDPDLALASQTIRQIEAATATWRRRFVEAARTAAVEIYRKPLEDDVRLWNQCVTQWGLGSGFKDRVSKLLRDWFEKHTELNDELERIMTAAWDEHVIRELQRLTNESTGETPQPLQAVA